MVSVPKDTGKDISSWALGGTSHDVRSGALEDIGEIFFFLCGFFPDDVFCRDGDGHHFHQSNLLNPQILWMQERLP